MLEEVRKEFTEESNNERLEESRKEFLEEVLDGISARITWKNPEKFLGMNPITFFLDKSQKKCLEESRKYPKKEFLKESQKEFRLILERTPGENIET